MGHFKWVISNGSFDMCITSEIAKSFHIFQALLSILKICESQP